ncbi:MAG: FHA domain-containing protein [Verrucomicrobiota bacterium]|nr:FHA domain-containing protein [Verrucomicrobiota bacterium]
MARLIIRAADGAEVPHELIEQITTIGRAPESTIQIDDPSISMRHAELRLVGDKYQLKDLGSTNGTHVDGRRTREATLRGGERIRFGEVDARCEAVAPVPAQPLPVAAPVEAKPAEESTRPVDFRNASPFPDRKKMRDPLRTVVFAAAAIAFLAWVGSVVAVLLMQAPGS